MVLVTSWHLLLVVDRYERGHSETVWTAASEGRKGTGRLSEHKFCRIHRRNHRIHRSTKTLFTCHAKNIENIRIQSQPPQARYDGSHRKGQRLMFQEACHSFLRSWTFVNSLVSICHLWRCRKAAATEIFGWSLGFTDHQTTWDVEQ